MSRVFQDATPSQKAERNTKYTYDPPKALVCAAMQKFRLTNLRNYNDYTKNMLNRMILMVQRFIN